MSLILKLRAVARTYPGGRGVTGIDLEAGPGDVVGLVGPNGSGKTTLARVIGTLAAPTAGEIEWFGSRDRRSPEVRRRLGVVTDEPAHFDDLTGRQNAHFFARSFGLPRAAARRAVEDALARFGLADAAGRKVREYSLGMRRRLALAEALLPEPELVVLDEPTLGLDHAGELQLLAELRRLAGRGAAVVLASNDVRLAERACTWVVFLHGGRAIREGAPSELLAEVASTQEIELTLAGAVDPRPLAALAGVRGVAADRGRLRVVAERSLTAAELLASLDGASGLVTGLTVHRPDLGDLFMALTGSSLDGEG